MATRNEYTETVRDLQALVRKEADAERRERLGEDLKKMAADLEKQREGLKDLAVLAEKVRALDYLVKGVILAAALAVLGAIIAALLLRGIK